MTSWLEVLAREAWARQEPCGTGKVSQEEKKRGGGGRREESRLRESAQTVLF